MGDGQETRVLGAEAVGALVVGIFGVREVNVTANRVQVAQIVHGGHRVAAALNGLADECALVYLDDNAVHAGLPHDDARIALHVGVVLAARQQAKNQTRK